LHRQVAGGAVPRCRPEEFAGRYAAVARLIAGGLITAAHAVGRGGLLPALFHIARAGACGVAFDLSRAPQERDPGWEALLFGESCGRILLVCAEAHAGEVVRSLDGHPATVAGALDDSGSLAVADGSRLLIDVGVEDLAAAWRTRGERA
jgi:phosphoribosylformylglycinamidine (FGAM) synthase-like enzyme